jgi:tRNA(fMet)-specific endonuclease VapC
VQFGRHYLLDTNTVRYVIKGSFPHVRGRLAEVSIREVGTSVITEAELRFGVARLAQATKLGTVVEEFLRRIEVMAWDSAAAQRHGRLRAVLEEQGDPWATWIL